MKIELLKFKNFANYGDEVQQIHFNQNLAEFYLILGKNGDGKCLSKSTEIEVDIEDPHIKEQFLEFLKKKKNH